MPFTTEQFFKVFESYNQAVYPAQWVLILLAIAAVFLALRPRPGSSRLIALLLAILWTWAGIAYHLAFFTRINGAAYLFSLMFLIQVTLFLFIGLLRGKTVFRAKWNRDGIIGGSFIVFALLIYPALGFLSGHSYPRSPTFGTPCPVTIFTFGILVWTSGRVPIHLLMIPFVWSLVGSSAAIFMDIREDIGLLMAGIAGSSLIILKSRFSGSLRLTTRPT
jgi:hypothetical protein